MVESQSFYDLHRRTLKNGLRVWCVPRRGTGTVVVMSQLPVGVRTETSENNGISHFLEHMLFTGTERWDEAEVTEVIRRRGGEYNGQTSREETVYYIHVAADEVEFAVDWTHQLLCKPTLSADKLEKERQVIINEKGGEYDRLRRAWEWIEDHNLGWSVSRTVRRRLFPESPLLMPVIGRDKTLNNITHTDIVNYYQDFYGPNNITLLIVGDVDPEKAFNLVEQYFGEEPSRPSSDTLPPIRVMTDPFQVRLHGPTPTDQGQFMTGAMLGAITHPDRFAWWTIAEMLENAYLLEIRYELGLSYGVQAYTALYSDVGYFGIYTTTKVSEFEVIRQVVEKHLKRLVDGDFSEQELTEAKAALRGRTLLNLQDNLELAWWLSSDSLMSRDDNMLVEDYFAEVEKLKVEEIQRVAQQYLSPEKRFVVEHRPSLTPAKLRPIARMGALSLAGSALLFTRRRFQRKR